MEPWKQAKDSKCYKFSKKFTFLSNGSLFSNLHHFISCNCVSGMRYFLKKFFQVKIERHYLTSQLLLGWELCSIPREWRTCRPAKLISAPEFVLKTVLHVLLWRIFGAQTITWSIPYMFTGLIQERAEALWKLHQIGPWFQWRVFVWFFLQVSGFMNYLSLLLIPRIDNQFWGCSLFCLAKGKLSSFFHNSSILADLQTTWWHQPAFDQVSHSLLLLCG